jgi:hypothetical protein
MIHPDALVKLFEYNALLVNKQLVGMSDAECLLHPPFTDDCINWLLGHMISARTRVLGVVDRPPVWDDAKRARYKSGAAPVTELGNGVLPIEVLLSDFNVSQQRLVDGLQHTTFEQLSKMSGYEKNTVADSLAYFHYHEAVHVGQIIYLAQYAGKLGTWL